MITTRKYKTFASERMKGLNAAITLLEKWPKNIQALNSIQTHDHFPTAGYLDILSLRVIKLGLWIGFVVPIYILINAKKNDYNWSNIFKRFENFWPLEIFHITRFAVTSLLVTLLLCSI